MPRVLEKLREEIGRVQLLRSKKAEMFDAVRDPTLLRSALRKFDHENDLLRCNMCPLANVYKHVQEVHNLLVAERDAILREEPNQAEPQVEMEEDEYGLRLHVSCMKWDGALTEVLEAIEAIGLTVVQANISCDNQFIFDAFLEEETGASSAAVEKLRGLK